MDNLKDNWSKRDYRQKAKSFLRENNDFSRDQARTAWDSRILALRNNANLKGKDLRRQAYMDILNSQTKMPELDSNIEIQDDVLPDITFDQPEILQNTPVIAKRIEYKPKYKTFGEAFAAARKAGLKVFEYNGIEYNTRSKEEQAALNKQEADRKRKFTGDFNTDRDYNRGYFAILERPGIQASVPEVEIPEIQDSNVKVPFESIKDTRPFVWKIPEVGWSMPTKK